MNANVLNGQVTTCMIRLQTCFKDQIWNLYLSLSWVDIEIVFWGTQVLWHLYYSSSFKTGLGLKLGAEKKLGALLEQIGTWNDIHWSEEKFFYNFQLDFYQQGHTLRTNTQSFQFTTKLRNLITFQYIEIHTNHKKQWFVVTFIGFFYRFF